jgi:hypothetical protein
MNPTAATSLSCALLVAACATSYPEETVGQGGVRTTVYASSSGSVSSRTEQARATSSGVPRNRAVSSGVNATSLGPINVVEPGDTTMSCEELKVAIDVAGENVNALTQARSAAQGRAGTNAAISGFAVTNSYNGAYSNFFGPLTQALASKQASNDQLSFQTISENLSNATQRRTYLVGIHNQRCF